VSPGRRWGGLLTAGTIGLVAGAGLALLAGPTRQGSSDANSAPAVAPPAVVLGTPRVDRTTRSVDGAVAAAVDYATLLARLFPLDRDRARQMAADVASAANRPALLAAVDAELVPLQAQAAALPGATVYRQSVLATRVQSVEPAGDPSEAVRARVAVWALFIVGQSGERVGAQTNPLATFTTLTLDLVFERDAWRLDGTTQRVGPTPLLDGRPQAVDDFDRALDSFTDWRPA
jgi:hypothetical protein